MMLMLLFTLRIHKNIINKNNYKAVQENIETLFIKSIKVAGAFVNLKDINKNS